MNADATNNKEQPLTQDKTSQSLLNMVWSIAGSAEKKEAEISSTTAASLETLELAKVAAGIIQSIMAKGLKIGKKSWGEVGSHHKWLDSLTTDGGLPSPEKHLMEWIQVVAAGGEQGW